MLIGYARVSKSEGQDTSAQVTALKKAGAKRIFEDKASGARWDRPELKRLLDHLRPGDVLVVWKLDRLSRSLRDLIHIMEQVHAAGAAFRSLPALANLYGTTTDAAIRAAIEVNYVALNGYAGSVGELLGVQLFSGLWLVLLGLVFRQIGFRLHGVTGALLGVGFALASFRTIAPELGVLGAILPPLGLVWLLALAVTFWRKA